MSNEKIERVITLAERLIAALEADVAALEAGQPQLMKSIDPDIQKLSLLYAREAGSLNTAAIAKAPADPLHKKLAETTRKFRDVLTKQARILTRMRNASEGIIHAVADEVHRRQSQARPYSRTPAARPATAMIFNATA